MLLCPYWYCINSCPVYYPASTWSFKGPCCTLQVQVLFRWLNDQAANLGTTFANKVLAVLNYGIVIFGAANGFFTTPTALDLLGAGGGAQLMMI